MTIFKSKKLLVLLVILLRLSAAILILFTPVWGFIIYLIFDELDCRILCSFTIPCKGPYRKPYQVLDKTLDLFGYVAMLIVSSKSPFFTFMIFLFIFRVIGNLLFITTHKESFLFWFPDFFLFVFLWLILGKKIGLDLYLGEKNYLWGLVALFPIKIIHEILLHKYWPAYLESKGTKKIKKHA